MKPKQTPKPRKGVELEEWRAHQANVKAANRKKRKLRK